METMTSDIFLYFSGPGKCMFVHIHTPYNIVVLWHRDHVTHAWPTDVALHPLSGERSSMMDIARILSSAEPSVCFSFQYLVFILHLPAIIRCMCMCMCKAQSKDSCGCGRCYAACSCACLKSRAVRFQMFLKIVTLAIISWYSIVVVGSGGMPPPSEAVSRGFWALGWMDGKSLSFKPSDLFKGYSTTTRCRKWIWLAKGGVLFLFLYWGELKLISYKSILQLPIRDQDRKRERIKKCLESEGERA